MKSKLKYLLPLIIFLVLSAFFATGLKLNPHELPSPLIGKPAPMFTSPVLNQADKTFSPKDMLGQVWVLNVWASWCSGCRDEHPLLMDVSNRGTVPLMGLNYKDMDTDAIKTLDQFGDPYTIVASDPDGRIGINYGVYGVPETYLIDKTGNIRYKHIGPLNENAWYNKIVPLIKELQ